MAVTAPRELSGLPRVGIVVVNYNGGDLLTRALRHLLATEWPADRLRVVVVDNASSDGSADAAEDALPNVEVLRTAANLGFAGGSNFGIRHLADDVDFVALVNNDAFVEPDWLAPLIGAFDVDDRLGATCPKILFATEFAEVDVEAPGFVPGPHDTRILGVRLTGCTVDGVDVSREVHVVSGGYGEESSPGEPPFVWLAPQAKLWVPAPKQAADRVLLRLAAEREKTVRTGRNDDTDSHLVGPEPAWKEVGGITESFNVINNAGSVITTTGSGADRGFWSRDIGQFEASEEVFAWCGAAVVLRRAYLDDAGLFDDDYFLYYEDFDLSWRGRLLGWRYRYVPEARVRHVHSATAVEGSPLFAHFVARNRLLTLVKNAPMRVLCRQLLEYWREVVRLARYEVIAPLRHRTRPHPVHLQRRVRSFLAFVKMVPSAWSARRDLGRRRSRPREMITEWWVEW